MLTKTEKIAEEKDGKANDGKWNEVVKEDKLRLKGILKKK